MTKVRTPTTPACAPARGLTEVAVDGVTITGNGTQGNPLVAADQHYRGVYATLVALQAAVPTGNPGDYADVDAGIGTDVQRYIWDDDDDEWVAGGGAEGTVNDPGTAIGDLIQVGTVGSPNTYVRIPDVATGNTLLSGGVGALWTTGKVGLTTHVSGTLPVANGGTGTTTPGLVAGTDISITGTWPNQTINSTAGGGSASRTLFHKTNASSTPVTGTTNETIITSISIPAGSFQANDVVYFKFRTTKTGSNGTTTIRARLHTSGGNVGDAFSSGTQILTTTALGATSVYNKEEREIVFKNSLSSQTIFNTAANAVTDLSQQTVSAAISALSVDFSTDKFLVFTVQFANGSDSIVVDHIYIEIIR